MSLLVSTTPCIMCRDSWFTWRCTYQTYEHGVIYKMHLWNAINLLSLLSPHYFSIHCNSHYTPTSTSVIFNLYPHSLSLSLTYGRTLDLRCHIHSEVPYEDQRLAFEKATPGKIKLIIANNMAVSSVTFPDVDTVICLGIYLQYLRVTQRAALISLKLLCWRTI